MRLIFLYLPYTHFSLFLFVTRLPNAGWPPDEDFQQSGSTLRTVLTVPRCDTFLIMFFMYNCEPNVYIHVFISIINICAYIIVTALRKTNDNPFVPPPHLNYRLGKVECGETLVCLFSRNLMCIKFHQQHEGFGSQAHFILNQNDYHYFLKRHKQTICSVVSYCLGEMVMVNFFVFNIESAHQQRNGLILNWQQANVEVNFLVMPGPAYQFKWQKRTEKKDTCQGYLAKTKMEVNDRC